MHALFYVLESRYAAMNHSIRIHCSLFNVSMVMKKVQTSVSVMNDDAL